MSNAIVNFFNPKYTEGKKIDSILKAAPSAGSIGHSDTGIVPALYQAWGAYGYQPSITWYQLANMYVSWVYTSVEKISRTIASMPPKLYRYEKEGSGKSLRPYNVKAMLYGNSALGSNAPNVYMKLKESGIKRIEVEEHPFLDLVNRPNDEMVRYNFWRLLSIHLELNGSVGIYKAKPYLGRPTQLYILPTTWSGQFKPIPCKDGTRVIDGYKLIDQDLQTEFTNEEIIWPHYTSLRNPYEGMSALKAQLSAFNLDQYLNQQTIGFYKNGAMFSNVFSTEKDLTQTQYNAIAEQLQNYQGAKNAGQKFLLHSGMKMEQPLQASPSDAMIVEIEKMARDKMLSAMDLSAGKIGLTDHQNRSNLETVDMGFFNEAIRPRCMLITEYFDQFLVHQYDKMLDFEFDYPHFEDRKIDIAERDSNLKNKLTTINEERMKLGLSEVEWGHKPFITAMDMQWGDAAPGTLEPEPSEENQDLNGEPVDGEPIDENKKMITKAFWSEEKKAIAWKKFDRVALSYEKMFRKVMIEHFNFIKGKVLDNLEKSGVKIKSNTGAMNRNNRAHWLKVNKAKIDEFYPSMKETKARLIKAITPAYLETLKGQGQSRIDEFSANKKAFNIEFNVNDPKVKKWLGQRLQEFSETTEQTTKDKVSETLRDDFEEGLPLSKMSEHLRDYFDGAETYRANLIARTETTASMNRGDIEGIRQMGLDDQVGKVWLNEPDARETHKEAGERYSDGYDSQTGEQMTIDKDFEVGDDKMQVPGEGNLAEEVCNCRCGMVYEILGNDQNISGDFQGGEE